MKNTETPETDSNQEGLPLTNCSARIPLRWRAKWFSDGMKSLMGFRISSQDRLEEVRRCVDEMIETEDAKAREKYAEKTKIPFLR